MKTKTAFRPSRISQPDTELVDRLEFLEDKVYGEFELFYASKGYQNRYKLNYISHTPDGEIQTRRELIQGDKENLLNYIQGWYDKLYYK